jgi:predicted HicB family RNase H-like nuclease
MAAREPRPALSGGKPRRLHPASPLAASTGTSSDPSSSSSAEASDRPVMLCVRVPKSLRKRVKLAALESGRPVQELVGEALERECRRAGV